MADEQNLPQTDRRAERSWDGRTKAERKEQSRIIRETVAEGIKGLFQKGER